MEDFILEYEPEFDILSACSRKREKVFQTVPLGEVLIDLSKKQEILGIEIEDASISLNIPRKVLIRETEKEVKEEYLEKIKKLVRGKLISVGSMKDFKERYEK